MRTVRPKPRRSKNLADAERRIHQLEDELLDLRVELSRSESRVEAMKQIGQELGSNLELDILLERLVARTTEILDADRSTLFFVDPERRELCSQVLEGSEMRELRLPFGSGVAGWVAENNEPLHIPDAYKDPRFNRSVDKKTGYRTRGMLVWPIRDPHRGGVSGVIQVLNKNSGSFDRGDERLLSAIASEIGVALAAARLYQEVVERNEALERTRGELQLLLETERAISSLSELEAMLASILGTALERFRARSGVIYLLDEPKKNLVAASAAGTYARDLARLSFPVEDPSFRELVPEGVVHTPERRRVLRRGRLRVHHRLLVPIVTKYDGVIGALEILEPKGGDLAAGDLAALRVVASQAGRAINAERQRRAREQAENLETIGRMLSGAVHDLRTPLTLLSGYADVLVEAETEDERKAHARGLHRQVEHMSHMLKDLLSFARGERSILVRKVYLDRFMAEIEEYLRTELDGTGVKLELDLKFRGAARFDETKLRRVIHNLARNAREAMPGGGRFRVSLEKQKGELVFTFSDNGPGIPAAVRGRVFQPFSTHGKTGGTGLGLAMVKHIVEEHEGTVSVQTSKKGTTFRITLPA